MRITFYGGAGGVTGSKFLLEVGKRRLLLDCGTFQGLPDVRERNRNFPFPPDSIDAVVLSHAHIDHCGMLPLLVKRGFRGSVFMTPATADLAERMLKDAAGIELQDADFRQRHHVGAPDDRVPLFTPDDIPAVVDRFRPTSYVRQENGWHDVTDGVRLKFYDAGHILGSAVTVLECTEGNRTARLAYTGDLGPRGAPLLFDPQVPTEDIGVLIMESTYGRRRYEPLPAALERLTFIINAVQARGGKIIVPAFSLGRTQAIVYWLHKLTDEGKIPRLPIFVDSPLATDLTDIFHLHPGDYDLETWRDFAGPDHVPLAFRNLTYTRTVAESKQLNILPGPFIVIAASGMMTAGRVVHHLRHSITDARNAIFITGYQAAGTTGRRLLEGAQDIELLGEHFPVRAEVYVFNEFSAHADRTELRSYAEQVRDVRQVFLVHGEPSQADEFKNDLAAAHPHWQVTRPGEGDVVEIGS